MGFTSWFFLLIIIVDSVCISQWYFVTFWSTFMWHIFRSLQYLLISINLNIFCFFFFLPKSCGNNRHFYFLFSILFCHLWKTPIIHKYPNLLCTKYLFIRFIPDSKISQIWYTVGLKRGKMYPTMHLFYPLFNPMMHQICGICYLE